MEAEARAKAEAEAKAQVYFRVVVALWMDSRTFRLNDQTKSTHPDIHTHCHRRRRRRGLRSIRIVIEFGLCLTSAPSPRTHTSPHTRALSITGGGENQGGG